MGLGRPGDAFWAFQTQGNHIYCSMAIGSKDVREDPYDILENYDQCLVILPYGMCGVFMDSDLSMQRIIIIVNRKHNIVKYWIVKKV